MHDQLEQCPECGATISNVAHGNILHLDKTQSPCETDKEWIKTLAFEWTHRSGNAKIVIDETETRYSVWVKNAWQRFFSNFDDAKRAAISEMNLGSGALENVNVTEQFEIVLEYKLNPENMTRSNEIKTVIGEFIMQLKNTYPDITIHGGKL